MDICGSGEWHPAFLLGACHSENSRHTDPPESLPAPGHCIVRVFSAEMTPHAPEEAATVLSPVSGRRKLRYLEVELQPRQDQTPLSTAVPRLVGLTMQVATGAAVRRRLRGSGRSDGQLGTTPCVFDPMKQKAEWKVHKITSQSHFLVPSLAAASVAQRPLSPFAVWGV